MKPLNEDEWQKRLTNEQYHILREKGTEPPFTGDYCDLEDQGTYRCMGCKEPLFHSSQKFHSGSGWPSFWEADDQALFTDFGLIF